MRALPLVPIALALAFIPSGAQAYDRLPRALANLSPSDFAGQVRITENPEGNAVVLSTRDAYMRTRSIQGARANDVHLRAIMDRGTGEVSWQVWHELVYVDGPRDFASIEYRSGGEARHVEPFAVDHWRDECPPADAVGFCNHFARIGFELPDQAIREMAQQYRAGSREPWPLHFRTMSGRHIVGGLAPAEAAGLLEAVEAMAQRRALATAATN